MCAAIMRQLIPMATPSGTRLGAYEVDALLAKGGMGAGKGCGQRSPTMPIAWRASGAKPRCYFCAAGTCTLSGCISLVLSAVPAAS